MIISFTTIPTRLNKIEPMINSITRQGLPIKCWIPKEFKRKGIKWDGKLPKFMHHPLMRVEAVDDLGSVTKLLPAIGKSDAIITVDDDVIYPPDFVTSLISYNKMYPKAVLCYRGRQFGGKNRRYQNTTLLKCNAIKSPFPVDIVTGTWGCLYPNDLLDYDAILENSKKHPLVDDIAISAYLHNSGVKMITIPGSTPIPLEDVIWTHSLYELNRNHINNNKAISDLYE